MAWPPPDPARRINRQNKLPLYQQLYEILRNSIVRGEWKVGQMIPPEPKMMERFGVSRITVRQVLNQLVAEGLIYRQQGRGTFVAEPTLEQGLLRITSFTEDMQKRGLDPGTRTISSGLVQAPKEIALKLQVPVGEELARLKRLRLANGEPMSIEDSYLLHRLCPGVLERHDFTQEPLRAALERDYGLHLANAKQVIRAISANREQAQLLEVPIRSPLLFIERVSFNPQNTPVEFLYICYRADRYSLYNELHN